MAVRFIGGGNSYLELSSFVRLLLWCVRLDAYNHLIGLSYVYSENKLLASLTFENRLAGI
jgi:hypothetical protein